jgi:hypothetical protein
MIVSSYGAEDDLFDDIDIDAELERRGNGPSPVPAAGGGAARQANIRQQNGHNKQPAGKPKWGEGKTHHADDDAAGDDIDVFDENDEPADIIDDGNNGDGPVAVDESSDTNGTPTPALSRSSSLPDPTLWARPPLPALDARTHSLAMQQLDADYTLAPADPRFCDKEAGAGQNAAQIRMFGVTANGNSVLFHSKLQCDIAI